MVAALDVRLRNMSVQNRSRTSPRLVYGTVECASAASVEQHGMGGFCRETTSNSSLHGRVDVWVTVAIPCAHSTAQAPTFWPGGTHENEQPSGLPATTTISNPTSATARATGKGPIRSPYLTRVHACTCSSTYTHVRATAAIEHPQQAADKLRQAHRQPAPPYPRWTWT